MVYINETSGTVSIPRHTKTSNETYTLLLKSNMSDEVKLVEDGSNISTNPLYYRLVISDVELNVGEYTYELYGSDVLGVLETGLLTYGNYRREVIVNNTTTKEKVQYNG